jgi:hypothetical protein
VGKIALYFQFTADGGLFLHSDRILRAIVYSRAAANKDKYEIWIVQLSESL